MAMGGGRMRWTSSTSSLMATRSAGVARSHTSSRRCVDGRRRSAALLRRRAREVSAGDCWMLWQTGVNGIAASTGSSNVGRFERSSGGSSSVSIGVRSALPQRLVGLELDIFGYECSLQAACTAQKEKAVASVGDKKSGRAEVWRQRLFPPTVWRAYAEWD
eukprot:4347548-Pleurochrysis_carterae.AAC.3